MNKATYKKTSSNTLACISSPSLPTIPYQRRKTVWNGAATCRRVVAPSSVPEVRAVPWWTLLLRAPAAINCFMNLLLIITFTRRRAREDRGRTLSLAGAATSIKNTWTPQRSSFNRPLSFILAVAQPQPIRVDYKVLQLLQSERWGSRADTDLVRTEIKLQTPVYDILPSTTAVFSYAIGSR